MSATGTRRYQAGRSKAMINVIRYNASGATHRRGMTAMSVEMWFVVAMSATDANAARMSQRAQWPAVRRVCWSDTDSWACFSRVGCFFEAARALGARFDLISTRASTVIRQAMYAQRAA